MIKYEILPADTLTRISEAKRVLAEDKNIVFAYLFGGLTSGSLRPLSDIDIAVYIKDVENLAEYKLNLFDKLTNSLGTSEIDLVILNTASVSLAGRIVQRKQNLIDKDPPARHAYESLILREFFDFKIKFLIDLPDQRLLVEKLLVLMYFNIMLFNRMHVGQVIGLGGQFSFFSNPKPTRSAFQLTCHPGKG